MFLFIVSWREGGSVRSVGMDNPSYSTEANMCWRPDALLFEIMNCAIVINILLNNIQVNRFNMRMFLSKRLLLSFAGVHFLAIALRGHWEKTLHVYRLLLFPLKPWSVIYQVSSTVCAADFSGQQQNNYKIWVFSAFCGSHVLKFILILPELINCIFDTKNINP